MPKAKLKNKKPSSLSVLIRTYVARYFRAVPPLILIFILLIGFLLLLKPKYNSVIHEVENENQKKSQQFAEEERYRDNLILLQRAYRAISENDLSRLNKMLPNQPEIENIMVMLENIAGKQYIKLNSLGFDLENTQAKKSPVTLGLNNEQVKKININMDVGGIDYRGFKKLLAVLENNLRLFDIDEVDFSPEDNSLNLAITAYYWENNGG